MQSKHFSIFFAAVMIAGIVYSGLARAENWIALPVGADYESNGFTYDADSVFVDSATGYIVVNIMDDMFFMTSALAIDCINRQWYQSVLTGLDGFYDPDWQSKSLSLGPSDYVFVFANEHCPIRDSLRVGTIQ